MGLSSFFFGLWKFTSAYLFQIALEIIWLPEYKYTAKIHVVVLSVV